MAAVTNAQVPSVPPVLAALHASQTSPQLSLQQRPSRHIPLMQSALATHTAPRGRLAFSQLPAPSHVPFVPHGIPAMALGLLGTPALH